MELGLAWLGLPVWRSGAGGQSLDVELGGGVVAYHLAGLVLLREVRLGLACFAPQRGAGHSRRGWSVARHGVWRRGIRRGQIRSLLLG